MRKQLLIIVTLFCFVILLVGTQSGFAKPKKAVMNGIEDCFNTIDDDGDGYVDCADSDCESSPCDTGLLGICAAGTVTCMDEMAQCTQNNQSAPEVCDDLLDNDCDGLVDAADPECVPSPPVEDCFNTIDDNGDGLVDCADPTCENAQNGSCPTDLLGICAEGTLTCVAGENQCIPNTQPSDEICGDGLDNNCNGAVDANDLDCAIEGNKVTICHIPRGNPGRAHTIKVGLASLPAHEAHGDTIGPCPENSSKRPKKHLLIKTPKKT